MKNDVQQTSLLAWQSIQETLGKRQQEVYDIIKLHPGIDNQNIANNLELPINSITPRTNELVKSDLVKEYDRHKSSSTGRSVIGWEVVSP